MVNGIKNYYSHWERLHAKSAVYGIVWQEHLAYAYIYTNHKSVKKMLGRIKEYDNKINALIEPITLEQVNEAFVFVAANNWPPPDCTIDKTGKVIELKDRTTGELLNNSNTLKIVS